MKLFSTLPTAAAALLVLAQALPAAAQFEPNPVYEFVTSRLEREASASFAFQNEYASLDSIVVLQANDNDGFDRQGVAVFTRSGDNISVVETGVDEDGPYTESVSGPFSNPSDGELSLPVTLTYTDGGAVQAKTLDNRSTFAGGRVQNSKTQLFIRSIIDIVSTDEGRYYYDAQGRLITDASDSEIGGFQSPSDSSVHTYDAQGRLASSATFDYEIDDNGVGGFNSGLSLTWDYINEGHIIGQAIDGEGNPAGQFVYRFRGTILDSFYLTSQEDGRPLLGIVRSGDRSTDNIRQYDYLFFEFQSNTVGVQARSIQYLNGATSSLAGAPPITGEIVTANPTRSGAVVRFEGEVSQAANWRLVSVGGRVMDVQPVDSNYHLPQLEAGIYFLSVVADGFADLGRVLVVE